MVRIIDNGTRLFQGASNTQNDESSFSTLHRIRQALSCTASCLLNGGSVFTVYCSLSGVRVTAPEDTFSSAATSP